MLFVWYKNLDRSFFRFVTMHAFDRQTNGRTEFSSLGDRVCIARSAVKIKHLYRKRFDGKQLLNDFDECSAATLFHRGCSSPEAHGQ